MAVNMMWVYLLLAGSVGYLLGFGLAVLGLYPSSEDERV